MNRRGFLRGLVAAPAIVAIDRIMPVKLWRPEPAVFNVGMNLHEMELGEPLAPEPVAWLRRLSTGLWEPLFNNPNMRPLPQGCPEPIFRLDLSHLNGGQGLRMHTGDRMSRGPQKPADDDDRGYGLCLPTRA